MNYTDATKQLCKKAKNHAFNPIEVLRRLVMSWGIKPNPVGVGNHKTGVPSTYRPVGSTCPDACRYLKDSANPDTPGPCYALHHWTGSAQKRASEELKASALSFAIAAITAASHRVPARLHVSGDFILGDVVDVPYVQALCDIAREVTRFYKLPSEGTVAWSYTHIEPELFEPYRLQLKAAGIEVLYSDRAEAGGAVVWPFSQLAEFRAQNPGLKVAPCPAQNKKVDVNCGSCNHGMPLCAVARERNICVAFDPHGSKKKSAERQALQLAEEKQLTWQKKLTWQDIRAADAMAAYLELEPTVHAIETQLAAGV